MQDFFQMFNVSNATTMVNKLLECSPSNSPLGLSLGYSAANFLVPQIQAHEDAKTQLFVMNDEWCTILMKREVITRIQLLNV